MEFAESPVRLISAGATSERLPDCLRCGSLLRQTAFSLLLALGVPPHVVRGEIAGHSDIEVTMTVYAHGKLAEKAAALTQLGDALSGGLMSAVAVKPADVDPEDPATGP